MIGLCDWNCFLSAANLVLTLRMPGVPQQQEGCVCKSGRMQTKKKKMRKEELIKLSHERNTVRDGNERLERGHQKQ